eukprot:6213424-Pleurochrysis_carterae.AAC.2
MRVRVRRERERERIVREREERERERGRERERERKREEERESRHSRASDTAAALPSDRGDRESTDTKLRASLAGERSRGDQREKKEGRTQARLCITASSGHRLYKPISAVFNGSAFKRTEPHFAPTSQHFTNIATGCCQPDSSRAQFKNASKRRWARSAHAFELDPLPRPR